MKKAFVGFCIIFLGFSLAYGPFTHNFHRVNTDTLSARVDTLRIISPVKFSSTLSVVTVYSDTADFAYLIANQESLVADYIFCDTIISYVTGYREKISNILFPPHAWGRFADSAITIDATQNTWYQITNDYDSLFGIIEPNGFTWDADTIFAPIDGAFIVQGVITLASTINDNLQLRIMTSNEGEISKMGFDIETTGKYKPLPLLAYWSANAGDKLWLEIRNTASNDDPTIRSGMLLIKYFHLKE